MKLGTLFSNRDPEPAVTPDALAQRRIAAARACRAWTEIDADRLVPQPRGRLVDPETDELFSTYGGDAFSPSGTVVADMARLAFYVDGDDIHVLERQT